MTGDFANEPLGHRPPTRGRQKARTLSEHHDARQPLSGSGLGDFPQELDFDPTDRGFRRDVSDFRGPENDPYAEVKRVKPRYKGLILKPKSVSKGKSSDWSIATKHDILSTQEDLGAEVKKRRNSKKPGVSAEFSSLTDKQQKVIGRLIDSYQDREENNFAIWSLALIKPVIERDGWSKVPETKSIQIILLRQDRDDDTFTDSDYQKQRSSSDEDEIDISKPRHAYLHDDPSRRANSFGSRGQDRLRRDLNQFRIGDDKNHFDRDDEFLDGFNKRQGNSRRSKSKRDKHERGPDDFYQDSSQLSPTDWPEDHHQQHQSWPQDDGQDFAHASFVTPEPQTEKKAKGKKKGKANGGAKQTVQIDDSFAGLNFQAPAYSGPSKNSNDTDNFLPRFTLGDASGPPDRFNDNAGPSFQPNHQGWQNDLRDHDAQFGSQKPQAPEPQYADLPPQHDPSFNGPQLQNNQVLPTYNQHRPAAPEVPPFNGGNQAFAIPGGNQAFTTPGGNQAFTTPGGNQAFAMPGGWQDPPWDNHAPGFQNARHHDDSNSPSQIPSMSFQQNNNKYPNDPSGPNKSAAYHPFEPFPHIQSQPQNSTRYPDPLSDRPMTPDWQRRESSRRRKASRSRDRSSSHERGGRSRRSSSGKKDFKRVESKLDDLAEKLERMQVSSDPSEPRSDGSTVIFSEPYADKAFTPPSTPPRSPIIGRGSLFRRDSTKYYRSGYHGRHGKAKSVEVFPGHSGHERRSSNVLDDLIRPHRESSRGKRPIISRHSESYDDFPRGMIEDRYSPERPQRLQRRLTDYDDRDMYGIDLPEHKRQREAAQHMQDSRRRSILEPAIRHAYNLGRTHERGQYDERGQYGYDGRYLH